MQYIKFLQNISPSIVLNLEKVVITTNCFGNNCSVRETQMIKCKQSYIEGSIIVPDFEPILPKWKK